MRRPKIKLISLSDRPQLSSLTFPQLRAYCRKHRYASRLETRKLLESRHPAWCKVLLLIEEVKKQRCDYLVWIDDDILITRPAYPLERFIRNTGFRRKDQLIMVQEDAYPGCRFNTGFLIVKCLPAVIDHLSHVWMLGAVLHLEHQPNWEQDAMIAYHDHISSKVFDIVPYGTMQHFLRDGLAAARQWKPGSFSAHITGMATERKVSIAAELLRSLAQPKSGRR